MTPELPADVDPRVSFFSHRCQGDDYLYDAGWHTFPGRMAAYCPHDPEWPDYRISLAELPRDLPLTTRCWVAGFLAGNLPRPPDELWDEYGNEDPGLLERWKMLAEQFRRTGWWPSFDDEQAFYAGQTEMPALEA